MKSSGALPGEFWFLLSLIMDVEPKEGGSPKPFNESVLRLDFVGLSDPVAVQAGSNGTISSIQLL